MRPDLAGTTWPDVTAGAWIAVPLGSTEQHGPHLPLGTDTAIATELTRRLAAAAPWVRAAPALAYGSSGEHAGFPGTLSIGQEALEMVLVELGRSADHFDGLIFVNGHGGNAMVAERAAARLRYEGRRCHAWGLRRPDGAGRWDAHAGFVETSIALALGLPGTEPERSERGNTAALADLDLARRGVKAVAPNGVLGDPAGAEAATGKWLLDRFADDLYACAEQWRNG